MSPNVSLGWTLLACAIALELSGTLLMKMSDGFTRPWPSVFMFVCYGVSFTLLNFSVRHIPLGVAYAIWSGVGITLIGVAGHYFFGERLKAASLVWMGFILVGIVGLKWSES
ncbi:MULTISPECIES: DMT family transporter [Saccharibacillus]|uniref:Multidrug efflux SMR transporter n=1 Tax=Saccharibacillus brassicae TaxID=2583377 RepID=A0A4Y6URN0_SACBS|nr:MULTISPECIES: multidrug efflux SMR transporter [Saccharibacillus]MWJ31457.1 QacE family quaternary ammonium compound efflux SMR transporter [Saccharibacillus sp. WB 17]QDH20303.1 multidrug efflux SMR transporter [Saccharibacillus brassicae]